MWAVRFVAHPFLGAWPAEHHVYAGRVALPNIMFMLVYAEKRVSEVGSRKVWVSSFRGGAAENAFLQSRLSVDIAQAIHISTNIREYNRSHRAGLERITHKRSQILSPHRA